MDALTYNYKDVLNNNKLDYVADGVAAGNYTEDIDGQAVGNYDYDKIGNLIKDGGGNSNEKIDDVQWTVYGKIRSITKHDGTLIEYGYDPTGNRISKTVTNTSNVKTTSYYFRDATGNVMAVYEQATASAQWNWAEQDLYGSSRLGMWKPGITMDGTIPSPYDQTTIGSRVYELTNHLGNVLATISDKRIGVDANNDGIIDYNDAEIITANDYYPFGMQMPGREYSVSQEYRYGFNGQEKSSEIIPGLTTALFWEYDSRTGRRWNMDPLSRVEESPYSCIGNSPILFNDPLGDRFKVHYTDASGAAQFVIIKRMNNKALKRAITQSGNDAYVTDVVNSLIYMKVGGLRANIVMSLMAHSHRILNISQVTNGNDNYQPPIKTIQWDNQSPLAVFNIDKKGNIIQNGTQSAALGLYHEMVHAFRHFFNPFSHNANNVSDKKYDWKEERRTIRRYEDKAAKRLWEPTRNNHSGNALLHQPGGPTAFKNLQPHSN
jgi:RHS repeat-associated protein